MLGGFIFASANVVFLLISSVFDIRYKKIPNKCTLSMLAFILSFQVYSSFSSGTDLGLNIVLNHIAGALVPLFIILPAQVLTKKSFGAGDKKLFIVLGLLLGVRRIIYFLFIMLLCALLFCVITKAKKGEHIAMAPFMLISYLLINIFL